MFTTLLSKLRWYAWVWELPQTLCGLAYALYLHSKNNGTSIFLDYPGSITVESPAFPGGGVTLGQLIFVRPYLYTRDRSKITTIRHEHGHSLQSIYLGPFYLLVIGLPSLIHAALHRKTCKGKSYYHFFTEKWANKLVGINI